MNVFTSLKVFSVALVGMLTLSRVARNLKMERGGAKDIFRPMYRKDVSTVPTNTKEKSKLTKPRAEII